MARPAGEDALLVSPSVRRQLPTLLSITALLCVYPLLGAFGLMYPGVVWLGAAVFGSALAIRLVSALRSRGAPWELRLDANGVTVRGHRVTPWSDFETVRVTGLRPRWLFFLPHPYRVVSFIGRPGVELHPPPSATLMDVVGVSARLRQRWYGTQLVVMAVGFDATADTMLNAVCHFSDVPVHRA